MSYSGNCKKVGACTGWATGVGKSSGGERWSSDIDCSSGVSTGDGEGSVTWWTKYGCLWGSGEMSMLSMQPGDEEGTGGVVPSMSIGGVLNWSFLRVSFTMQAALESRIGTYTYRAWTE